VYFEESRAHCC